ncbi:MAG: acetyl-CoA decarbonylase/synthase complex subunit delta [Deltaproteobacteria bacterium]|nr:acetyl-CoA decarbonylase/synthase complex subunit delta [Deltaproteobacteria bacterium]MBW2265215.1 acetyl-CoA decarbonylase/synthase complex subunit delta [Deltaproteobacteria bacterium]MBW2317496.1 acetyl-CoA decarbonylase/synthase complex subunit delta [Deltaproteobacteria bacterium]MBW2600894.1 acetyl-CoA decarbonylase/synthase complex subunit delta [Deltaproteobacteria bacterium]
MAFEEPTISYNGEIREISLGKEAGVTVGGETCYPFYLFEGKMPHRPVIAMDVYDSEPEEWPESILAPFADVVNDPVAWAKKCVESYGAEMIALQLVSTDPNGLDTSPEQAVEVTKKVVAAINVPLIVWGVANPEKDRVVLKMVAEACSGENLILGPVEEDVYKAVGAAAIAYGHTIAASTPIDINLAKQLNILLGNLGVSDEKILTDPTVSSLGYGLEYCYSVMERIRLAALTQEDERLQFPILANMAKEVWKIKETKLSQEDDPLLGDQTKRGILLEAMTAQLFLLAGTNILVMRHPDAIQLVRDFVDDLATDN